MRAVFVVPLLWPRVVMCHGVRVEALMLWVVIMEAELKSTYPGQSLFIYGTRGQMIVLGDTNEILYLLAILTAE